MNSDCHHLNLHDPKVWSQFAELEGCGLRQSLEEDLGCHNLLPLAEGEKNLFSAICLNITFAVIKLLFQCPWKSNKLDAVTAYTFCLVIGKMILTT